MTLTITGSSTVTPLINASLTTFAKLYPDISVVLNMIDSSAGVAAASNGTADIGIVLQDERGRQRVPGSLLLADRPGRRLCGDQPGHHYKFDNG